MKKILIRSLTSIVILFITTELKAQDTVRVRNSILVSPFGLMAGNYKKLRIRLQHECKSQVVFGTDVKYFFEDAYPGFQLMPFLKIFRVEENTHGDYAYLTGVYGKNKGLPDNTSHYYDCYGFGLGAGLQITFGEKKTGVIDLAGGLKFVGNNSNANRQQGTLGNLDYYLIGPASIIDGIIAIGFKF